MIEYAWISNLLRDEAFTMGTRESSEQFLVKEKVLLSCLWASVWKH